MKPDLHKRNSKFKLGNFRTAFFQLPHDETECDGFMIEHEETGRLLFLTDCAYCPYDFSALPVSHVLIEANYSRSEMDTDAANFQHVVRGHMCIETCARFVKSLNQDALKSVGLIHLSHGHASPTDFIRQIKEVSPYTYVYIARENNHFVLEE